MTVPPARLPLHAEMRQEPSPLHPHTGQPRMGYHKEMSFSQGSSFSNMVKRRCSSWLLRCSLFLDPCALSLPRVFRGPWGCLSHRHPGYAEQRPFEDQRHYEACTGPRPETGRSNERLFHFSSPERELCRAPLDASFSGKAPGLPQET
jgi:hypothetical protein